MWLSHDSMFIRLLRSSSSNIFKTAMFSNVIFLYVAFTMSKGSSEKETGLALTWNTYRRHANVGRPCIIVLGKNMILSDNNIDFLIEDHVRISRIYPE